MKTATKIRRAVVRTLFYPPVCEARAVLNFAFGMSILALMAVTF